MLSNSNDNDKLYNWLKFIKGQSREEMITMAMADRDIDKALNEEIGNLKTGLEIDVVKRLREKNNI